MALQVFVHDCRSTRRLMPDRLTMVLPYRGAAVVKSACKMQGVAWGGEALTRSEAMWICS